jgi:hypothetical protein
MNTSTQHARLSVRWPFRILAVCVVVACVAALIGTGISAWSKGLASIKWQFLAALPGMVWLGRLAYAAIRGRLSTPGYWPFASQSVFNWYALISFAVLLS